MTGEEIPEEIIPDREQASLKVELNEADASSCLCPGCPTYNGEDCPADKGEKIYCSIGMTDCGDLEQKGCYCGDCPIFKECDLKVGYFCLKGEASESGEPIAMEVTD